MGLALLLVLAAPPAAVPPAAQPRLPTPSIAKPYVYRINRRKQGDYFYSTTTFEAEIARDGSVRFRDHHGAWGLFLPLARPLPEGTPTLEGTVREAFDGKPAASGGTPASAPRQVVLEICDSNTCSDPKQVMAATGATFDVTEEMMRMFGQDPYRYEKAKFLTVTADWRLRLAATAQDQRMDSALMAQHKQLLSIWRDRRYTVNERRRLLFNLWLEMDESPHGRKGAAGIEGFIRKHLPASSPNAFTAAELKAMNAAAAPHSFDPYGVR